MLRALRPRTRRSLTTNIRVHNLPMKKFLLYVRLYYLTYLTYLTYICLYIDSLKQFQYQRNMLVYSEPYCIMVLNKRADFSDIGIVSEINTNL